MLVISVLGEPFDGRDRAGVANLKYLGHRPDISTLFKDPLKSRGIYAICRGAAHKRAATLRDTIAAMLQRG